VQARMFYQAYKDTPFDKIYISALKRSFESVASFIEDGIPYEVYAGLDEISWGFHEGVEASPERNVYFRELVAEWNGGQTAVRIEGGESPEDVASRQRPVIEIITNSPEENILICMHGRAMRILLCQLLGLPLTKMDDFDHDNLGLYVLNYDGRNFNVYTANSTKHLLS
jgi:2,3-bisphosphoglycerate-dependent phosphoglycerate mutase